MDVHIYQKRLMDAFKRRDDFLILLFCSLCLNILLGLGLVLHGNRVQTIVIPAGFKEAFWINSKGVSAGYLSEMTRYFSSLLLNMTPENSQYQREQLLQYVDPRKYGSLKIQLMKREDTLKQEGLTMLFYPMSVKAFPKQLEAVITGDLAYFVGQHRTSMNRVSYRASYHYQHGRLYLMKFDEVASHV
jgi:type IV conjugative transfer system protein TraE